MVWFTSGLPYVATNVDFFFIHLSTLSQELRLAVVCNRGNFQKRLVSDEGLLPVSSRFNFPNLRKFSNDQILLIEELAKSNYNVETNTKFRKVDSKREDNRLGNVIRSQL